jgi:hypothetical protein
MTAVKRSPRMAIDAFAGSCAAARAFNDALRLLTTANTVDLLIGILIQCYPLSSSSCRALASHGVEAA